MQTILIWGAGGRADLFLELMDPDKCAVAGFVDSAPDRQGTTHHGKPVHAPDRLRDLDFDALVVASAYQAEIIPHALALGLDRERIHVFSRTDPAFAPRFCKDALCNFSDDLEQVQATNWYHDFEIAPGVRTNGRCPFDPGKLDYFEATDDASGRTVLDIGAWDGPYTFEMERRGATVTAFDIQDPDRSGFNLARRMLGSHAGHVRDNVYNLAPGKHGTFDIVLYLGVWYHLKNPLLALSNIHAVLNPGGLLVFEGAVLDHGGNVDPEWQRRPELLAALCSTPACLYVAGSYENDDSNWTIPTRLCLEDWLRSSGFDLLALDIMERDSRARGAARRIDDFFRTEHGLS